IVQIPYSTDATPCWLEEKLRWYCPQPLSSISMSGLPFAWMRMTSTPTLRTLTSFTTAEKICCS
ncbi:unnamed protein product, partial [Musa banksii]